MNAQIHEELQRMRLAYLAKLPQKLDDMETLVRELNQVDDCTDSFENLYRAVHTLKGTAGTYGLQIITAICTPFEDCLTAAHESAISGSDRVAGYCMQFIGILRNAVTQLEAGKDSFTEIETSLDEFNWSVTDSAIKFHAS